MHDGLIHNIGMTFIFYNDYHAPAVFEMESLNGIS